MRTIGIIGGMGPLATVDLYAKIVYAAQGKKTETMCPCSSADGRISRTGLLPSAEQVQAPCLLFWKKPGGWNRQEQTLCAWDAIRHIFIITHWQRQ